MRIINSMVEWKWSIFNDSRWSFGTVLQRQRGGDFVLIRFSFFNPSSPHNNNYQILHLSQNEKFYLPNQNKKKWATVKMVHISSVPPWRNLFALISTKNVDKKCWHTLSRSSLNSFYWRWVRRRWWHFGDGLEWSWICRSCKTTFWWWWGDRWSGHCPWWFRRTLSRFLLFDAFIQTQTLKWNKFYFVVYL